MAQNKKDFRFSSGEVGFSYVFRENASSNPRRHFHTWWEILYIASGERTFFFGNKIINVTKGDFLVIPPGVFHRGINKKSESCSLFNIFFDFSSEKKGTAGFVRGAVSILKKMESCIQLPVEIQEKLHPLFEKMEEEYEKKGENYVFLVRAILMEILVLVSRQKNSGKSLVQPSHEMSKNFSEILEWVNAYYTEDVSLSDTAKKFNITEEHLSRSFKENTQFNFVEYVNNLRIAKSCNLLMNSELSVLEIAMKCGFGSLSQYGRWFRKLTGRTPMRYRKR